MPEREVDVYRFEQLWREGDRAGLRIECSSGTYVRTLIADLGDAYCEELRRTRDRAVRRRGRRPGARAAARDALAFLPAVGARRARARRGGAVPRRRRCAARWRCPSRRRGAAARRRRPDRARRAREDGLLKPVVGFRGVKVTRCPTPSRGRARVAVGTFDGVHLGHREVIARRRHRPHVRPAPARRSSRPRHDAAAAHDARAQGRADRARSGVAGAGRDPVRRGLRRAQRRSSSSTTCSSARSARRTSAWARTSASATGAQGDPRCCAPTGASRRGSCPLLEVDGEIVSSSHIRGLVARRRRRVRRPAARRAVRRRGRGRPRRRARARARLPDRQPRPREGSCVPGHGVYACRAGRPTAHAAAVNVGVRPTFETGRGELIEAYLLDFDGDLYGQPLRSSSSSGCAASGASTSVDALSSRCRDVEATREVAARPPALERAAATVRRRYDR